MYYMNIGFAKWAHKQKRNPPPVWRHIKNRTPLEYSRKHGAEIIYTPTNTVYWAILRFKKSGNIVLAIDDKVFDGQT